MTLTDYQPFRDYLDAVHSKQGSRLPAFEEVDGVLKVYHGEICCRVAENDTTKCGSVYDSAGALRAHIRTDHPNKKTETLKGGNPSKARVDEAKGFYRELSFTKVKDEIAAANKHIAELVEQSTPRKKKPGKKVTSPRVEKTKKVAGGKRKGRMSKELASFFD